ncbi:MAG: hypothetical protein GQ564_21830 [Bacteroidales bacterium]|nr:hypothetical protein [Bacteroidales bacterium]
MKKILFLFGIYLLSCCIPIQTAVAQETNDFMFFIRSAKDSTLYLDLKGVHYSAEKENGVVQLYENDEGADRLIKVIPCPESPQFVYLQPMHSEYVLGRDSVSSETQIKLIKKRTGDKRIMFELLPVLNKKETYKLKLGDSFVGADLIKAGSLYLEKNSFEQAVDWVFEKAELPAMARFNKIYSLRPLNQKELSLNVPGNNSKVTLFKEEEHMRADRFVKILTSKEYPKCISLQPQHSDNVLYAGYSNTIRLNKRDMKNMTQMFEPIFKKDGDEAYYLLKIKSSGLYLTSNGENNALTQERLFADSESQKWVFDEQEIENMAAPANEVYSIQNMWNNEYLDLPGFGRHAKGHGSQVSLYRLDDAPDRYYKLEGAESWKSIQPLHGLNILGVKDQSNEENAQIILTKAEGNWSKRFRFEYAGAPMTYYIINNKSGLALSIDKHKKLIQVNKSDTDTKQKWKFHEIPKTFAPIYSSVFYIKCAYSNKYWDLSGRGGETNRNGKKWQIWDWDGDGDRKFRFIKKHDSWLRIEVQNGKRVVDVQGGRHDNGVPIQLYTYNRSDAQSFEIQITSPTTFVLITKKGKAIDVGGGNIDNNGGKLVLWDLHYGRNQQFQLINMSGQVHRFF